MSTPLTTANYVLYYGKSQDAVALEIFESKSFRMFCHSSLANLSPLIDVCLELNIFKVKYVWVWRIRASLVKELLSCSYGTVLLPRSCQQYFLCFFVRRSEIVFYVPVKETDRKISLSVEERKRSSWKRNISIYLFYIPFAYLFCRPCFETIVACLKASVWDPCWHWSF